LVLPGNNLALTLLAVLCEAADNTTKQIADRIKETRLQKGLTQADLAGKAGINTNYYAKVERGELKPSIETYKSIAKALSVKSSDIFPF
jgi:transcriptional regulator with XRE-family HTH domain